MSCSKLPPELLDQIFEELDTPSLVTSSQVCSRWRHVTGVSNNPGYIPRVVSTIFHHLDHKTLLNARGVCSLWRDGMDMLTNHAALPNKCQTILSTDFAKNLLKLEDKTRNPFPSRIVRVVMTLNEHGDETYLFKMNALRDFGGNVRFLNLRLISGSSRDWALLHLVKTVLTLMSYLPNLEGLIIQLSFVYDKNNLHIDPHVVENASIEDVRKPWKWKYLDHVCGKMMPLMGNLKALRLVSWSPSSPETEWLYYKILQNSPNLEFLDPDLSKGLEKFSEIRRKPKEYPFNLKCLKLAMPGEYCHKAFGLMKPPLTKIFLDIFEYNYVKDPTCEKVIRIIVHNCAKTLKTLALNFYKCNETTPTPAFDLTPSGSSSSGDTTYWRSFLRQCYCHRMQHGCFPALAAIKPIIFPCIKSNAPVLEDLKLRGFEGSLDFLRRFKNLKRLILMDFKPEEQKVFKEEGDFYRHLPSLTELYTPHFGSLNVKGHRGKMVDHQYLPMYW